ncbi:MAG: exodeoxyribonuclease VII large subunit, partial [Firmicutes bacterium]|nr:exodeoxyribonuclease VII large subunit [Bacillota bacterium]
MALRPITVTQLNDYIARVFESDTLLMNVACEGEISNLKYHSSGHVYFSISDENAKINCFFPASYVRNLRYELGDGMR